MHGAVREVELRGGKGDEAQNGIYCVESPLDKSTEYVSELWDATWSKLWSRNRQLSMP